MVSAFGVDHGEVSKAMTPSTPQRAGAQQNPNQPKPFPDPKRKLGQQNTQGGIQGALKPLGGLKPPTGPTPMKPPQAASGPSQPTNSLRSKPMSGGMR